MGGFSQGRAQQKIGEQSEIQYVSQYLPIIRAQTHPRTKYTHVRPASPCSPWARVRADHSCLTHCPRLARGLSRPLRRQPAVAPPQGASSQAGLGEAAGVLGLPEPDCPRLSIPQRLCQGPASTHCKDLSSHGKMRQECALRRVLMGLSESSPAGGQPCPATTLGRPRHPYRAPTVLDSATPAP